MSNLVEYAKQELARVGGTDDPMQAAINDHIIKLVGMFAEEGHSGFSASYAVAMLEKLLRFEPLTPLTGADDEWTALDYNSDMAAQNRRCSHVFKRADGRAYDSEGKIFVDADGFSYTSKESRVYIDFPYTPKREIVHRAA